ncbi:helix-turn-helix domain-containing protein [Spirosoma pollinicola]|uniref:Helix-turn-helix domain-containing protein n=1 Tax=Spirosoma pollinicola TaxID=2057025 RepID=A0A2K8ZAG8_9BACT|nr:hypothetical protein CWM47_36210 [Spirosoma pollinicola]
MYSVQQVAIILDLKESKIRSFIRQGKLKAGLSGSQHLINKIDLYHFIKRYIDVSDSDCTALISAY